MTQKNTKQNGEWYEDWFNSPYYHILYKHRDHDEAEGFIQNLDTYLKPPTESVLLDAACGKGRHARFMANLGYEVDGFDLSPNNIAAAKKLESERLRFFINDIRKPLKRNHYDFVFNLFTSFGYFNSPSENQEALEALSLNLKPGGLLILDFMNCKKVVPTLPSSEEKTIEGIKFNISKVFDGGKIIKTIDFEDQGLAYRFNEVVNVIYKNEFELFFKSSGLVIEHTFGDYELSNFDEKLSDRLIFIARKA